MEKIPAMQVRETSPLLLAVMGEKQEALSGKRSPASCRNSAPGRSSRRPKVVAELRKLIKRDDASVINDLAHLF